MGDEVLEDTEFEPMFDGCKDALKGRTSLCLVLMDGETANGCVTEESCKKQVQMLYATA